jgi:hypothetical protein
MDVATFTLHRNAVRAVHRYLFVFLSQQRRPHCTALLRATWPVPLQPAPR